MVKLTNVVIDPSDRELFRFVKELADSDFDEEATTELFDILIKKKRLIRYTQFPGKDKIYIDFPKSSFLSRLF